jgi:hypothetical protein
VDHYLMVMERLCVAAMTPGNTIKFLRELLKAV